MTDQEMQQALLQKVTLGLYAVKDDKARTYGSPFTAKYDVLALRQFREFCKNSPASYAEDMSLYHVGDYNIETGMITPIEPVFVGAYVSEV